MTFRVLQRQKGYTFINIAGWAAGLACCMLILLFVIDEVAMTGFMIMPIEFTALP